MRPSTSRAGRLPVRERDALATLLVRALRGGDARALRFAGGILRAIVPAGGSLGAAPRLPDGDATEFERARRILEGCGLIAGGADRALLDLARDTVSRQLEAVRGAPAGADLTTALAQAGVLLDLDLDFEAHEILEPHWLEAEGAPRLWLQGLIQLAASGVHRARGNAEGAIRLAEAAATKLAEAPKTWRGFPLGERARQAASMGRGNDGGSPAKEGR